VRRAPLLSKFGNLTMRENLVVTLANVRPYKLWGRGRGVPRQPDGGVENATSWQEIARCSGQPAFFLEGNRMTTLAFEKAGGFFLKLGLFRKTIQFDRSEV